MLQVAPITTCSAERYRPWWRHALKASLTLSAVWMTVSSVPDPCGEVADVGRTRHILSQWMGTCSAGPGQHSSTSPILQLPVLYFATIKALPVHGNGDACSHLRLYLCKCHGRQVISNNTLHIPVSACTARPSREVRDVLHRIAGRAIQPYFSRGMSTPVQRASSAHHTSVNIFL